MSLSFFIPQNSAYTRAQALLKDDVVVAVETVDVDTALLKKYLLPTPSIVQSGSESAQNDEGIPQEIVFTPLRGLSDHPVYSALLEEYPLANTEDAYNFLNFSSGVLFDVQDNTFVEQPYYLTLLSDGNLVDHSLIRLGKNSKATLVIEQKTNKSGEHRRNGVVDVRLSEGAQLTLIEVQAFAQGVEQTVTKRATLAKDAKLIHTIVSLDGSSQEKNLFHLSGEGASITFRQAVLGMGKSQRIVRTEAIHSAPKTTSSLATKNVVDGTSSVVSHSNVLIESAAQQSVSQLTDHSLILSAGARAESIPGMEVLANDVRAGHAASTTQVNAEQVFYLMSRGLSETEAKESLILGFLQSILDVPLPFDVRSLLQQRFARDTVVALSRDDFPILRQTVHGKPLVYLDSAATSQKPLAVLETIERFYREDNANIHRGLHTLSERATQRYEDARKTVAGFIGANAREIIFVRNTTEGINLLAQTLGKQLVDIGDVILLTEMEHHSNIVPWQLLAKEKNAILRFVKVNNDGTLDMNALKEELKQKPKIVALTHVSNVLGTVNPIKEIVRMAHDVGAKVIIDGAQSVPHIPVDVKDLACDAFVFSGHKMLGPTGIGVVYVKDELLRMLPPYMGGGGMIKEVMLTGSTFKDGPERFEAGTPDIAGAIGLAAAVLYLQGIGMDRVSQHDQQLIQYTLKSLAQVPFVKIYGPDALQRVGSVAFNLGDIHAHDVSTVLDECAIAIRAGHHCAQPLMERFNAPSMCRVSFSLYNNKEDVDALVFALQKAVKLFRLDRVRPDQVHL